MADMSFLESASRSANYMLLLTWNSQHGKKATTSTSRLESQSLKLPFSMVELTIILKHTHDACPGRDAIHNQILWHPPTSILSFLPQLYYRIWIQASIASNWGETILVPILKGRKYRSLSSSYRPVCLTSCVCQLL